MEDVSCEHVWLGALRLVVKELCTFFRYYCSSEQKQVHDLCTTMNELIKIIERMIWLGLQLEQMKK